MANKKWPSIVGTSSFSYVLQPIRELMGDLPCTSFVLSFGKTNDYLPRFGLTTFGVKNLFWEVVRNNDLFLNLPCVKLLEWNSDDSAYWDDLKCDNNNPVHISFDIDNKNPSMLNVTWSHKGVLSSSYKISLDQDFHLLIFTSLENFRSKRYQFVSTVDYLTDMIENAKDLRDSENLVCHECISCTTNNVEYAFVPCGHCSFCSDCVHAYTEKNCPICKTNYVKCVKMKTMSFCLTCPDLRRCKQLNCMLSPCAHVVGCFKSTQKGIQVGDWCPVVGCESRVDSLFKIFTQSER